METRACYRLGWSQWQKMKFSIIGKIKPYVRMTQRGKWVKKNAQEYLASKSAIALQLKVIMVQQGYTMLDRIPFKADIIITMPGRLHCQDIDNQTKAILDAAQGIVFSDDRWCDALNVSRGLGDDDFVTTLEVTPL